MQGTYLVQRLLKPPKTSFDAKVSRVFGGCMLQMKAELWDVLQTVFDIDYMMAAEYELGVFPRSLRTFIKDRSQLEAFSIHLTTKEIDFKGVRPSPKKMTKREAKKKKKQAQEEPQGRDVYVLCRASQREGVVSRIKELALEKVILKRGARFAEALSSAPDQCPVYGWYELDNGFFFFIDKEMWERATKLFRDNEYDEEAVKKIQQPPVW